MIWRVTFYDDEFAHFDSKDLINEARKHCEIKSIEEIEGTPPLRNGRFADPRYGGSTEWRNRNTFGPNVVEESTKHKTATKRRNKRAALNTIRAKGPWDLVVAYSAAEIAKHPKVYQRSNTLVETLLGEVYGVTNKQAMLRIREIPVPIVNVYLAEICNFVSGKDDNDKPKRVPQPPKGLATAVAALGTWPDARALKGIIRTPTIRPDGSILQTPGHDAATGYLYLPSGEFPEVPDAPSLDDARAGLAALLEPLIDFPFVDDVAKHAIVAAVLTILARAMVDGATPAFPIDASTPGSGKGLLAQLIYLIATGEDLPVFTFPAGDEAELEKIMGGLALAGVPIVCWDNIKGTFGGSALEKVLTSTRPGLRILGKSETPNVEWYAVTLATGNNLDIRADMLRRCIVSRLEPDTEKPAERTGFRIPDLKAWAREHRARLVVAGLTLLRAWFVAGKPDAGCKAFGDFGEWRMIAQAIKWAGGPDVIGAQPTGEDDPEHEALGRLFAALARLGRPVSAGELVLLGYESIDAATDKRTPATDPAIGWALNSLVTRKGESGRPSADSVGRALSRAKGRVIGDLKLVPRKNPDGGNGKVWAVTGKEPVPF